MSDTISTYHPANGELIKEYSYWTNSEIEERFVLSNVVYGKWKKTPLKDRLALLKKLANQLRVKRKSLANLIVLEMGKPLRDALVEVDKCAVLCDYYVENAEDALKNKPLESSFASSYIAYMPKGIILGIMPWNFPFWQAFRFAVPAIIAGNITWLKHAPNTTECNLVIERMFEMAGFPKGVYQAIVVAVDQVEKIIAHPLIGGVSLTGSERAGSAVASMAGKYIKTSVLELGGNDACLITRNAETEKAIEAAILSRMINSGQTCISTKRIFVPKERLSEYLEIAESILSGYTKGVLTDLDTKIGYMAREDLADQLEKQYAKLVAHGAVVVKPLEREGNFLSPALLVMKEGDRFMIDEELFGPIVLMYPFTEIDLAVEEINASPFGLGASVWSEDNMEATELANKLEVGCVAVNDFVKSDVSLPFGGTKRSGYGRELHTDALLTFTNPKTIYHAK